MTSAVPSSSSRGRGRRVLIGALSGALVAGGIVFATTASTTANAEPGTFTNIITIEPGTGFNAVSLYSDTGTRTEQPLANPRGSDRSCNLTDAGTGTNGILKLSGSFTGSGTTTNNVGLNGGSLGIAEKKSGTSCGQVEFLNSESMTLALADPSAVALSANFDMEVQKDAVVQAETWLNGVQGDTFRFESGKNFTSTPSRLVDGCQGSATSSGANSNTTDNCRWQITGEKFDTITLTALTSGQFSLEGGADGLLPDAPAASSGLPRLASFIELQDTLRCGESTFTLPFSGAQPGVTVRRLSNADPTQTCTGFTYELNQVGTGVTFVKPFDTQTSVQFVMELTWPITGTVADLPPVRFRFHNSAGDLSQTEYTLGWCPSPVITNGQVSGLNPNPLTNSAIPDMEIGTGYPGKQYACVLPTALRLDSANNPTAWVQPIYVLGDAFPRR